MVLGYVEIVLQLSSLGLVIAAAGLWAGAGVDTRPKFRDEQTLVGGTIWSQIVIPIGLMISKIVEENIDAFVQGFYLITGITLLWATGIVLVVHEIRIKWRRHSSLQGPPRMTISSPSLQSYDKVYYAIGIICFIAGTIKMCELILYVFMS